MYGYTVEELFLNKIDLRACFSLLTHLFPFIDTFNNFVNKRKPTYKTSLFLQHYVSTKGNRLVNQALLGETGPLW